MPVTKHNMDKTVDLRSAGWIEGNGAGVSTKNRDILQTLLNAEQPVYVPAGIWYVSGTINVSNKSVSISGAGRDVAVIINADIGGSDLLDFTSCDNSTIRDVAFNGDNWRTGIAATNAPAQNTPVYFDTSSNLRILDCEFSGFAVTDGVLMFQECNEILVRGNRFSFNDSLDKLGCDLLNRAGGDLPNKRPSNDYIITDNEFFSNNNVGVGFIQPGNRFIISNNLIVAKDQDGVELTYEEANGGSGQLNRKEGISIYNITTVDQSNYDTHQAVVSNNIIRNTRWSGIYCNANNVGLVNNNRGGVSVAITGNRIDNTCNETKSAQSANLQAGIAIIATNGCVVANNVITRVRGYNQFDPATGANFNCGITLSAELGGTENTDGTKMGTSIICNANHVSDVMGYGIWVDTPTSPLTISNNHVVDACLGALEVNGDCDQDLQVIGNFFWQTADGRPPCLKGSDSVQHFVDFASGTGRVHFANNKIKYDFAVSGGTNFNSGDQVYLLRVDGRNRDLVLDNEIEFTGGNEANYNVTGLRLNFVPSDRAASDKTRYSGNMIDGCWYGVVTGSEGTSNGPVMLENFRWGANAADITSSSNDVAFPGRWLQGTGAGPCEFYWTGDTATGPTSGNWIEGDVRRGPTTAWRCTSAGAGTAATWTSVW
jgi:hypothetical protein